MLFYTVASALINFVTSTLFGLLVFVRNPRNKINYSFALYAFCAALWSLCYFFWQISTNATDAFFWSRALMVFAILVPVFYSQFVFVLTGLTKKKMFLLILAYLLLGSFLPVDIFGFYFIREVRPLLDYKFWPIAGPIFNIFLVIWLGYVIYDTYLLYAAYKKATGIFKSQIKYIFWGLAVAFIGGITNYFLWYKIPIPPYGNILVSAYVTLTAVAIIRYRLMDIRLVVARTVSYTILTGVFAFIYALAFVIPTFLLASIITKGQAVMISTILAVIMAFSFQPLRRILEMISDKIFYKGGYDSNKLLSCLGSIMSVNIELEPLTSKIIQTLLEQMKLSKGAFVILGEGATVIYDIFDLGFPKKLSLNLDQIFPFLSLSQVIIFDELEENNLKSLMRNLDISVIKTLMVKNEPVGLLLLGGKSSGEIYSDQDLKIVEILAPEISVAIQNSESYDKIKKFNVTLTNEVQKATAELQEANKRLKTVDQLKDDFVSIASHELRTPMTAIRSYAWMALHRSDMPLSKTLEKYIARILISTERLVNLVNDMLNISRIESGKIEINPEPVNLLSLVKDIIDEVYFSKSEEKRLEFVVLEKPIPKVFADPEKLRQVFLNLVGNSLKFTPAGGKITFDFFTDGKVVETSVIDSGVGISKEDLSKLFNKFSRLDSSYTAAATSGGTGLGLYISRSLVELMHGKIRVFSEGTRKGTTFTVSLPVATPDVLKNIEQYQIKPVGGEAKALEPVAI